MFESNESDPLFFAHISGQIEQPHWPDLSLELVWEIFCSLLHQYADPQSPKINAFVILPNSFHLLITERNSTMNRLPERLALNLEAAFEQQLGRRVHLFSQAPELFFVTDVRDLRFVYRHIYQLPVRERLTERAEDYPFSSLFYLLGRRCSQSPMLVTDTFGVKYEPEKTLMWLNDLEREKEFWHLH